MPHTNIKNCTQLPYIHFSCPSGTQIPSSHDTLAPISMVSSCPKPFCCVHLGSIGVKFKMYSQICLKDHLYLVLFQEKIPGGVLPPEF